MMNNLLNNEYTVVEDNVVNLFPQMNNDKIGEEISLERFIENFLTDKKLRSNSTYVSYKSDLNIISRELYEVEDYSKLTNIIIEDKTIDDLLDYFHLCAHTINHETGERKFSNKTVNRRISALKSMLDYLVVREKIEYNMHKVCSILKNLPEDGIEIDVLEEGDAFACIEFFKTLHSGKELSLLGELALTTSLRANELLTLTWKQFTVKDGEVIVKSRGNIRGKGNKSWIKSISLEMYNDLLDIKKDEIKVFTISYTTLMRGMRKAINTLGLTNGKYSFHSFRKTSLTHKYIASGKDIHFTMEEAGHSDPRTTMKYLKTRELSRIDMVGKRKHKKEDKYKLVSHEDLLKGIELLDEISKMQLNKILDEMKKSTQNTDIIEQNVN